MASLNVPFAGRERSIAKGGGGGRGALFNQQINYIRGNINECRIYVDIINKEIIVFRFLVEREGMGKKEGDCYFSSFIVYNNLV